MALSLTDRPWREIEATIFLPADASTSADASTTSNPRPTSCKSSSGGSKANEEECDAHLGPDLLDLLRAQVQDPFFADVRICFPSASPNTPSSSTSTSSTSSRTSAPAVAADCEGLALLLGISAGEALGLLRCFADGLPDGLPANSALLNRPGTAAGLLWSRGARLASGGGGSGSGGGLEEGFEEGVPGPKQAKGDVPQGKRRRWVVELPAGDASAVGALTEALALAYGAPGHRAALRTHLLCLADSAAESADSRLELPSERRAGGGVVARAPVTQWAHAFLLAHRSAYFVAAFKHGRRFASPQWTAALPADFSQLGGEGGGADGGADDDDGSDDGECAASFEAAAASAAAGSAEVLPTTTVAMVRADDPTRSRGSDGDGGHRGSDRACCHFTAVGRLVRYMYTLHSGELEALLLLSSGSGPGSGLVPLAYAADALLLPEVTSAALDLACGAVDCSNSPALLVVASQLGHGALRRACMRLMVRNLSEVTREAPGFADLLTASQRESLAKLAKASASNPVACGAALDDAREFVGMLFESLDEQRSRLGEAAERQALEWEGLREQEAQADAMLEAASSAVGCWLQGQSLEYSQGLVAAAQHRRARLAGVDRSLAAQRSHLDFLAHFLRGQERAFTNAAAADEKAAKAAAHRPTSLDASAASSNFSGSGGGGGGRGGGLASEGWEGVGANGSEVGCAGFDAEPVVAFCATYEWQEVRTGQSVPAGLEVSLTLGGGGTATAYPEASLECLECRQDENPQSLIQGGGAAGEAAGDLTPGGGRRARIPPVWQLRLWVPKVLAPPPPPPIYSNATAAAALRRPSDGAFDGGGATSTGGFFHRHDVRRAETTVRVVCAAIASALKSNALKSNALNSATLQATAGAAAVIPAAAAPKAAGKAPSASAAAPQGPQGASAPRVSLALGHSESALSPEESFGPELFMRRADLRVSVEWQ